MRLPSTTLSTPHQLTTHQLIAHGSALQLGGKAAAVAATAAERPRTPEMCLSPESLPAGHFDDWASSQEELLLSTVQGSGDTPPAQRKCCCHWKDRKAVNAGYWMLGERGCSWKVCGCYLWTIKSAGRWTLPAMTLQGTLLFPTHCVPRFRTSFEE